MSFCLRLFGVLSNLLPLHQASGFGREVGSNLINRTFIAFKGFGVLFFLCVYSHISLGKSAGLVEKSSFLINFSMKKDVISQFFCIFEAEIT